MSPWLLVTVFIAGVVVGAALMFAAAVVYALEEPHARAARKESGDSKEPW